MSQFKQEIAVWRRDGPFTAVKVRELARAAKRNKVDIGLAIGEELHQFSSIQIHLLYELFNKHPSLFDMAYWMLESKDLVKMTADKLRVLADHSHDGGDSLCDVGEGVNFTINPEVAMKYFLLIREAYEMKKELEKSKVKTRHTAGMAASENRVKAKAKALEINARMASEGLVFEGGGVHDALYRVPFCCDGNEIKDDPDDHIDHGSPVLYDEHGKELAVTPEDEYA